MKRMRATRASVCRNRQDVAGPPSDSDLALVIQRRKPCSPKVNAARQAAQVAAPFQLTWRPGTTRLRNSAQPPARAKLKSNGTKMPANMSIRQNGARSKSTATVATMVLAMVSPDAGSERGVCLGESEREPPLGTISAEQVAGAASSFYRLLTTDH